MLPDEIRNNIAEKLVNKLAPPVCLICILFCCSVILFFPNERLRAIPAVPPLFFSLLSLLNVRRGRKQFGGFFLITGAISTIVSSMVISGGIRAPGFIGVLPCLLVTGSIYGSRKAFILGVVMIISGLLSSKFVSLGFLPPASDPPSGYWAIHYTIWFLTSIIFIAVLIDLISDALQEKQHSMLMVANAKAEVDAILNRTPDIIFKLLEFSKNSSLIFYHKARYLLSCYPAAFNSSSAS